MTTQKKKKSAKQKRVLIGSVVVAAAIVAGSTFAWFSSKDEVTNRLTASANYNVSIVEDFQPPKEWIPGQTINKDVAAVNTGNADAFVRMWLDGKMRVLSETTPAVDAKNAISSAIKKVENDESKTKLGLTYYVKNGDAITYYKELSQAKIDNPNDPAHATPANEETNAPAAFSEVQSIQGAGVLVYAPANAAYHWTLEQATVMKVGTFADNTETNLQKGTVVGTNTSSGSDVTKIAGASASDQNYYGAIDASTFQPETTGLYVFRRNIGDTADGTANTYEYSGYYFVKGTDQIGEIDTDTYFALHTGPDVNQHSDYVLPADAVTETDTSEPSFNQVLPVQIGDGKVFLFTAAEEVIDSGLTWSYNGSSDEKKFTVTKAGSTAGKDIVIDIALANIGTTTEKWTAIVDDTTSPGKGTTFYYTNDLEAGDTTTKLVDSVTLSEDTQVGAYLAFDFDLNVFLDSVQVTVEDQTGKETNTTVNPWAVSNLTNDSMTHSITAAQSTISAYDGPSEIQTISWTKNQ